MLVPLQIGQGYPHEAPKVKCETKVRKPMCCVAQSAVFFKHCHTYVQYVHGWWMIVWGVRNMPCWFLCMSHPSPPRYRCIILILIWRETSASIFWGEPTCTEHCLPTRAYGVQLWIVLRNIFIKRHQIYLTCGVSCWEWYPRKEQHGYKVCYVQIHHHLLCHKATYMSCGSHLSILTQELFERTLQWQLCKSHLYDCYYRVFTVSYILYSSCKLYVLCICFHTQANGM